MRNCSGTAQIQHKIQKLLFSYICSCRPCTKRGFWWYKWNDWVQMIFFFLHQVSHPHPPDGPSKESSPQAAQVSQHLWGEGLLHLRVWAAPLCAALQREHFHLQLQSAQQLSWKGATHLQMCREKIQKAKEKPKATYNSDNIVLVECLINDLRCFRADRVQYNLNLNLVHSSA